MTEPTAAPQPRLWTLAGFREDDWCRAETAAALAGNTRIILPVTEFLALHASTRDAAAARLGVVLQPADKVETIAAFLGSIALVALDFPAFNDGRSFSKAELLRCRHSYAGAIRATGQVLIDQIPLMIRTGFTEFEVWDPVALKRLQAGRLNGIPFHYQPTAKPAQGAGRYSWRRLPAP
jgi:uncharacterized protein (DUF934 family)